MPNQFATYDNSCSFNYCLLNKIESDSKKRTRYKCNLCFKIKTLGVQEKVAKKLVIKSTKLKNKSQNKIKLKF